MAVSITFDTLAVGGDITLVTPTVVYGTNFSDGRYNQTSNRTADGTLVTYDTGLSVVTGEILMKGVTYTEGDAFRTWLHEEAIFALTSFTITPPSGLDLGKGEGVAIADCNFVGQHDKGIFKLVVPGHFKIKFPYTFVR